MRGSSLRLWCLLASAGLAAASLAAPAAAPGSAAAARTQSPPRLGYVVASLAGVYGRYLVDAAGGSYVVEIGSDAAVDGSGSFVHRVWSVETTASGGVLDWRTDRPLPVGSYVVHAGVRADGGLTFSAPVAFSVVTACRIPDVRGRTLAAAKQALRSAGCGVGHVRAVRSRRRRGRVVRTSPPIGTAVPPGAPVVVFVSSGRR